MEKYEVIKFKDNEFEMDVNVSPNEDTVWLSQEEISILYASAISTINYHIKKIYYETELDMESTIREIRKVQIEGHREITRNIKYYNLDMIISIGYRVNSKRGVLFRKWANSVLKQYLLNGYAINEFDNSIVDLLLDRL